MGVNQNNMEKIQEITNVNEWQGQHGAMYSYTLKLESGKVGETNAKTNDRYAVGDTVWITEERQTNYGYKWKMSKTDPSQGFQSSKSGGNKDAEITASWAVGQALNALPELIEDMARLQSKAAEIMLVRQNLISNE
jgi:hypothetical protein